ncbi:IucA/IucC family siderophore biosynthesis protein [Endozoicomonas sp. 8E]|uniref:IucA/IucC family protein n=1 Tax=Endozoicomonas sp. 8E TaxID=3035692 RepID=UPI002938DA95|nr:IucA/IucC family siderophore biosynthesis protein [Endozoicomonas sp. 8E]WOG27646.1 IucA/IucC family siderophore biosynthesis protein [Endozoicomonas sp. 8E]
MNQAVTALPVNQRFDFWQKANRRLLAKTLSELSWEEAIIPKAIAPEEESGGRFILELKSGVNYRFYAWRTIWDQLIVDTESISRSYLNSRSDSALEVSQFFIDAREELGLDSATLANFLEELANTLMAEVQVQKNYHQKSAAELIELEDGELQCYLDGHPKVTVSKGRLGWGQEDYQGYATEFLPEIQLEWVALSRENCRLSLAVDLQENDLISAVLNSREQAKLNDRCRQLNIDASNFFLMPVHPWQWSNRLVNLFASEIAAGHIVHLGNYGDPMLPQQSLRTLSNKKRPEQLNIKLPLSILNTSCYRGIPGRYIQAGPMVSSWLSEIAASDPILSNRRTIILEEPAGAFYPNPQFKQITDAPYRYHEMLGCIWRQSVHAKTTDSERAILISTLFQKDGYGYPLICEYIHRSGLTTKQWLSKLFDVVVVPLYHLLCQYGVGLVAHGQNITLVLDNHLPVRVALKDFQGDLRLIDQDFPELDTLSDYARSVTTRLPAAHLIHDLQTGHFVTVLRFISACLAEKGFSESRFYQLLGEQLKSYMKAHPELEDRFKLFDLFTPEMARVCLNRVRFKLGYGDTSERPLPELGTPLKNPLAITLREE